MSDKTLDRDILELRVRTVLGASRRAVEVSQQELAERMGWSRNQITNVETGRRSVQLTDFLIIARCLNIDPLSLIRRMLQW